MFTYSPSLSRFQGSSTGSAADDVELERALLLDLHQLRADASADVLEALRW